MYIVIALDNDLHIIRPWDASNYSVAAERAASLAADTGWLVCVAEGGQVGCAWRGTERLGLNAQLITDAEAERLMMWAEMR